MTLQAKPESTEYLITNGFTNIGLISELFELGLSSKSLLLNSCGVYSITLPLNYQPEYIDQHLARQKRNVISPWTVQQLSQKWVENVDIVYFGLAGSKSPRSLRKRLTDLLKHGQGRTSDRGPHKGGEILWQLKDYETFSVWVKPTNEPPGPREYESRLINQFFAATGKLPFANRQF